MDRPADAGSSWRNAEAELRTAYAFILTATEGPAGDQADAQVQAQAAAFAELLHNTAAAAPRQLRADLRAAAASFNRANRSAIRAEHRTADALRQAGKALLTMPSDKGGDVITGALISAVFLLIALSEWHAQRGHEQQAAAARQSLAHLQAAYQQSARPHLAQLAARTPSPEEKARLTAVVEAAVPEHAQKILADPACPALFTALAQAESAGTPPRQVLTDLAGQRELDTADHPAEVLVWRLRAATADRDTQRVRAANARSTTRRTATPATPANAPSTPRQPLTDERRRSR